MLDPKLIRQNIDETATKLRKKGYELDTKKFLELEESRKEIQVKTEALQSERNTKSKSIGKAKAAGEDIEPLLAAVGDLGEQLDQHKEQLQAIQSELDRMLEGIPNIPDGVVPEGTSETIIKRLGVGEMSRVRF